VELAYEKETNPKRELEEDLKISREYAEKVFAISQRRARWNSGSEYALRSLRAQTPQA
jgi:hypothetical protein